MTVRHAILDGMPCKIIGRLTKLELDAVIVRMKEIIGMDFQAMTHTERVSIVSEVWKINDLYKAVDHDCELGTLLDALEALRADLEV